MPPIYSEGDVVFCFRGESTDEAKVIGVDENENRPVYEVELADGSSHSSSWEETVLKPNGWRAIVYNRHLNRESAAFASVWKDHEAFVRSVMETDAVGDDGADTDAEPTEDDPLPGVDLSMVPKILRKRIGEAAAEVRRWCKGGSGANNQHTVKRSAAEWPFNSFDYPWKDPMLLPNPQMEDFLLPTFGRVRFFVPSYTLVHQLDGNEMPCKWHGKSSGCVKQDCVFNPQGPRIRQDDDGGITALFSSRFVCTRRLEENRRRLEGTRAAANDTSTGQTQKHRRRRKRCYRCGKEKSGHHHNPTCRASTSSREYCIVPEEERTTFWRMPAGYEVGDTRQKEGQRRILAAWRQVLTEHGVSDEGWEDWQHLK
jgi:hypothetical protein